MKTPYIALLVCISFVFLYVASARAYFVYGDDIQMIRVTYAFVERGDFAIGTAKDANVISPGMKGIDGQFYSKFGIAQSLAAIPFYILGKLVGPYVDGITIRDSDGNIRVTPSIFPVFLVNVISSAGTCALLFLICVDLGARRKSALFLTFCLGTGTVVWHYSTMFLSEPLAMLAISLSLYSLLVSGRRNSICWLAISGFGLGLAIATRTFNAVLVPLYLVWLVYTHRKGESLPTRMASWIAPVLAWLVIIFYYDFVRFGSITQTGYGSEAYDFTTPILTGLYGLLASPGKGILEYNPILLLSIAGFFVKRWPNRAFMFLVLSVASIYIVSYSAWAWWWGGGVWGPRFLVPIIPLLLLFAIPTLDRVTTKEFIPIVSLCIFSVAMQIMSVVVPFNAYYPLLKDSTLAFEQTLWDPAYSPILLQFKILLSGAYTPALAFVMYHSKMLLLVQETSLVLCAATFGVTVYQVLGRYPSSADQKRLLPRSWSDAVPRHE
jgi:hypothetical protein